jgi:hypothetical protein
MEVMRMSLKALSWILFAVAALSGVLLLNYWAPYQWLATLAYSGIVASILGLANLAFPFRFMGVRRRVAGGLGLAGGVGLTLAALHWPSPLVRVAQPTTRLDQVMPAYQCVERHTARVHARPEQVMQAVRQSTLGDMKSLAALVKIRAAALRTPAPDVAARRDERVLEAFSGVGLDADANELVVFWAANLREMRRPELHTAQQFVAYREEGTVKMAFDFQAQPAGDGWSLLSTETRVLSLDEATSRGMGRYWRLIVPGSGLLRRQWLDGIRRRAESGL